MTTMISCTDNGLSDEHTMAIWTDSTDSAELYIDGQSIGTLTSYSTEVDCTDPALVSFSFVEQQDYLLAVDSGDGPQEVALIQFYTNNTGVKVQRYNNTMISISDNFTEDCNQIKLSW